MAEDEKLNEIKQKLKSDELIMGASSVLKELKIGNLTKVFTTSNCPKDTVEDIDHYANLTKTEVVGLDIDNEELGIICKRSHVISVLGLKK